MGQKILLINKDLIKTYNKLRWQKLGGEDRRTQPTHPVVKAQLLKRIGRYNHDPITSKSNASIAWRPCAPTTWFAMSRSNIQSMQPRGNWSGPTSRDKACIHATSVRRACSEAIRPDIAEFVQATASYNRLLLASLWFLVVDARQAIDHWTWSEVWMPKSCLMLIRL